MTKEMYFKQEKTIFFDKKSHTTDPLYQLDNGLIVREAELDTGRGGEPVELVQITDTHIGFCNEQDLKDPELALTDKCRRWCRDGASVPQLDKALEYGSFFDCMILTGDCLDFHSGGSQKLLEEHAFRRYPGLIACVGGHDLTRQMETDHDNTLPLEVRVEALQRFWPHDIQYYACTLKNKVTVVALNNNTELYREHRAAYDQQQYESLKKEIESARREGRVLLLFQHEALHTGNGEEDALLAHYACGDPQGWEKETYQLIITSADVIRGVFAGHLHTEISTEIRAGYFDEAGSFHSRTIPQRVLTSNVYGADGRVMKITVR